MCRTVQGLASALRNLLIHPSAYRPQVKTLANYNTSVAASNAYAWLVTSCASATTYPYICAFSSNDFACPVAPPPPVRPPPPPSAGICEPLLASAACFWAKYAQDCCAIAAVPQKMKINKNFNFIKACLRFVIPALAYRRLQVVM